MSNIKTYIGKNFESVAFINQETSITVIIYSKNDIFSTDIEYIDSDYRPLLQALINTLSPAFFENLYNYFTNANS